MCCCHSCQLEDEVDHNTQTVAEGVKGGLAPAAPRKERERGGRSAVAAVAVVCVRGAEADVRRKARVKQTQMCPAQAKRPGPHALRISLLCAAAQVFAGSTQQPSSPAQEAHAVVLLILFHCFALEALDSSKHIHH